MTKETKKKVKTAFYATKKREASTCLMAMGAKPKDGATPESWEGMMSMLSQVFSTKAKASSDEKAVAVLMAAKWMVSQVKCELHKHIAETEEMIAHELEPGADSQEDIPAGAEDQPQSAGEVKAPAAAQQGS